MSLTSHQIKALTAYQDMFEGATNSEKIVQLSHHMDSGDLRHTIHAKLLFWFKQYYPRDTEARVDVMVDHIMDELHQDRASST